MQKRKALILCQKSKLNDWTDEVAEHFENVKIITLHSKLTKKKQIQLLSENEDENLVIIASYETAQNRDAYLRHAFNAGKGDTTKWPSDMCMIVDESQTFKGRQGKNPNKRSAWAIATSKQIKYISLLSGDPISKQYIDLYNQFVMLGAEIDWDTFNSMFVTYSIRPGNGRAWPEITGYRNLDLLFEALHSQAVLIKTEEVHELPEQNFYEVKLEPDNKTYKQIVKNRVYKDYEFDNMGALRMALKQAASGFVKSSDWFSQHKIVATEDIITSTDGSVLIFYNFDSELAALKTLVKDKLKLNCYEVNGHNDQQIEAKADSSKHVILAQYMSGAKGLNLPYINYTIWFSPTESGEHFKQSIKRTHRIGQTRPTFYYKFITRGTLEARMYASIEQSQDYTNAMFEADLSDLLKEK